MRSFTREGVTRVLLERLVLKNFKRFKEQEILFRDGITGIIGNNGTGKSTIVEAILFALYGLSGTGLKPEFIVSSFAGPRERCEIRLDFRMRGNEYSVVRLFRKGSTTQHEVKLFAGKKLLVQSVSEVEREMVRLIGMDALDLKNTIYAGQRDLIALLESRPGERKEWFSRALGLDVLKDMSLSRLKERIDATERKRDLLQGELDGLKSMMDVEEVRNARSTVSELERNLDSQLKTLDNLREELARTQADLNIQLEQRSLYLRITEQLEKVKNSLGLLHQRQDMLRSQWESLRHDREEFERCSAVEDDYYRMRNVLERDLERKRVYDQLIQERRVVEIRTAHLDEQLAQVRQRIQQMQSMETKRSTLVQRVREGVRCPVTTPDESLELFVRQYQDHLTEQIGALHEAMEDAARKREELLHDRDALKIAGPEGACPLCHQRLGDHYHHLEADYGEQLTTVMKEAEETCSRLERLESEREGLIHLHPLLEEIHHCEERLKDRFALQSEGERLDTEREVYEAEATRHTRDLERHSFSEGDFRALERRVKELEQLHDQYQTLGRRIAPLPVIEQQVTALTLDISEMERERSMLEGEIAHCAYDPEGIPRVQETIAVVQDRITVMERNHARDLERKKKTEEMITRYADLERRIDESISTLRLLEEEVRLLRLTRTTIAEFVVYLMQVVRSQIELYAGEILSDITGARYTRVLLDGDFNIRVSDLDNDYPIERFSGGEQDDIGVALRIALSRYLAELHQIHDSTFLIFDEIFGSQDEERRNNLLRALRTQESYFPQIILISHIPEIQGEFATTLVVEMGSDLMSTVREVS